MFQTRDGSHASEFSTHIVDGLQLIQSRDGLSLVVIQVCSCFFVSSISNVSHVEVRAPKATIVISLGQAFPEGV